MSRSAAPLPSHNGTPFAVIEAPSVLGLRPTGVERLPEALIEAGLLGKVDAQFIQRLEPPEYNPQRDNATGILNPDGLKNFSLRLADSITDVLEQQLFPIVLGGDCSNIIGIMLALRRLGRFGLIFVDGHADFYQPDAEPNGEVASMDLAIVSGRGPALLTDIEGLKPLVRDEDIVAFGYRDSDQQREFGSQDIRDTAIQTFTCDAVRNAGVTVAAAQAVQGLVRNNLDGIWLHLDADVLDDAIMPAVDYRLPGGFSWDDLSSAMRVFMETDQVVGMNIGIFNPTLDADGTIARNLVSCIVRGLVR